MRKYTLPQPQRVRRIERSFAWIDHRLLRNGYLQVMTHPDQALYLFLVLPVDGRPPDFAPEVLRRIGAADLKLGRSVDTNRSDPTQADEAGPGGSRDGQRRPLARDPRENQ